MVTERQKRIYNVYLKESRRGQPYKLRKNFDKMDAHSCSVLEKLDQFLSAYPNIEWSAYFSAPHKIYPDESKYSLDFFITQKAKKAYALHMKSLETQDPDTIESIKRLQTSLQFVLDFCREKGLTLEQYAAYCEDSLPCVVDHLKTHKITYYTLHSIGISRLNIEQRVLDFVFGDFYGTLQVTKNKFFASKLMKEFSKRAITKIQNKLKENK
jgi:hypothetical protein